VKVLRDILYKAGITEIIGSTDTPVIGVTADSRAVFPGWLFVAVRGTIVDGHNYIDNAIELGALVIVCEELPEEIVPAITYVRVNDASYALGNIASNFFGVPSARMRLIGITGTNGKTTCATLLYNLFTSLGHKCGLISTVENRIGRNVIPSTHTTPDPVSLNQLLADMADEQCTYAFMEVSSHAVAQNRITGVEFTGAVFTNLTLDHLDYHKTFENYRDAKKKFFDQMPYGSFALVNNDDRNGMFMMQNTKAKRYTYGLKNMADYKTKVLENHLMGLHLIIDGQEFWTKLIGNFNAYNLLAVYATAVLLGESKVDVLTALSALTPPEGRFQYIKSKSGIAAIVDYAHTPDALENVLNTIAEIRTRTEQVITVVGCGGNRDRSKRPLMAKIACDNSDKVILTSDNPRNENPEEILAEMQAGVEPHNYKKSLKVTDRREAIRTAISLANPGDIILVAGKGHEKYQEIEGIKHPFDDMEVIKETFNQLEN
jgi:UDP-N-acetylmuramoyl-L-alanyl-D-glutamate--2,6-diaminopimelate ligase